MHFTAQQAVDLFKEQTGFELLPSVVTKIISQRKIDKCGVTTDRKPCYDAIYWEEVWVEMVYLSNLRAKHDHSLTPPKFVEIPSLFKD